MAPTPAITDAASIFIPVFTSALNPVSADEPLFSISAAYVGISIIPTISSAIKRVVKTHSLRCGFKNHKINFIK